MWRYGDKTNSSFILTVNQLRPENREYSTDDDLGHCTDNIGKIVSDDGSLEVHFIRIRCFSSWKWLVFYFLHLATGHFGSQQRSL